MYNRHAFKSLTCDVELSLFLSFNEARRLGDLLVVCGAKPGTPDC